jgi:hypothetical protein
MSSSALKRKLSGSTDGKMIKIMPSATPGTAIHTAVAGQVAGTFDEIWLWAYNNHSADVLLTIEFGSASTLDNIKQTIPYQKGLFLVCPGLILQNGTTVAAFTAATPVISITGFVNTMVDG